VGLTVTVLGCSGTYATEGNACSGYLVRSDTTVLWLDAGPGTLANLQRHVALPDVDAVVISHSHPDHWLELPVLRNAWRYRFHVQGKRVLATAETQEMANHISGATSPTFVWETIDDGHRAVIGDLALRFSGTDHPVTTMGVRIEHEGRILGYTADTGPDWTLAKLDDEGAGFDLALCEATLEPQEERSVQHCSARQAATMAKSAGVRHLVLTHLMEHTEGARRREAEAVFDGPISIATVHEEYVV
jgi:ribonuclease BN (tRNA processing enzyme)